MLRKDIHRQHLYNLIIDLFRSSIGKHIAFKWGTACYFLYRLPRFSTDIDLDLIGDRPKGYNIDDTIFQIVSKYGKIKQWHQTIISYGTSDTNINIDISRKIRKHNHYEIKNFFWQDILVQDIATIIANKLVALTERAKNRDYFDAWYLLSQAYPINEDLVIERTGDNLIALYTSIIHHIEQLPAQHKMLDELGETLYDDKQKNYVKMHLLNDLKGICQMRLMS